MLRYRSPAWLLSIPAAGLLTLVTASPAHADMFTAGSAFKPTAVTSLKSGTASTKTIAVPKNIGSIVVAARGTSCLGVAPKLAVKMDGKTLSTFRVGATKTSTKYSIAYAPTAGNHTFSLLLTNATPKASCVRTLRVDSLTLVTKTTSTTAPVTSTAPVVNVPLDTAVAAPAAPAAPVVAPVVTSPAKVTAPTTSVPATSAPALVAAPAAKPVEAETLAIVPSSMGKNFTDSKASGGSAALIWNEGAIDLYAKSTVASVAVRVKADLCEGPPTVTIAVDGKIYSTFNITWTAWQTQKVTLPTALAYGSHKVTIAYINNATVSQACDRNVRVDWIGVNLDSSYTGAPAVTTPPVVATTPPVVATTPPVVATTPPVVATTPPVVATTPPVVATTPPVVATTPPVVATSPKVTTPPVVATTPVSSTKKLKWAPPVLVNPITITLGTGQTATRMDTTKDYIIKFPAGKKDTTVLMGGHNVVMIGGHLGKTQASTQPRALFLDGMTGVVHIEGLDIDNTGGTEGDGIAMRAPLATVQIQNTRIWGVTGTQAGDHGDLVQPWGGVKNLRIDRFSGSTAYQGFFLRPDVGPIGSIELSNIDLNYDRSYKGQGGFLLWFTTDCKTAPAKLSEVYLNKTSYGMTAATSIWPKPTDANCAAKVTTSGTTISAIWPTLPITGGIKSGLPASGEFVPDSVVSGSYATPGYIG